MPTKQQTFDTVVSHLRKQKARSSTDVGCAYRGAGGMKCAVGVLIPDNLYHPEMEQRLCVQDQVRPTLEHLEHDILLCRDLQQAHDCYQPSEWEGEFIKTASAHKLTYTPPN